MKARVFLVLLVCLLLAGTLLYRAQERLTKSSDITAQAGLRRNVTPTKTEGLDAERMQVLSAYSKLPMSFEVNQGQTTGEVKFLSRGSGYTLFLTPTEAVMALKEPGPSAVKHSSEREMSSNNTTTSILRIKLLGADPESQVEGLARLPGKSNYFIGNDAHKWHNDVQTYARVKYHDVYPGVDIVYYGNQRQLENDFIVNPGASPAAILLGFQAEDRITIDTQGDLVIATNQGQTRLHKPYVYQEVGGSRQQVAGRYVLRGTDRVGFDVPAYDATKPLVIDPVLVYSTFLGGNLDDEGQGIAVDSSGNAYITGVTASTDFPTRSAFQGSYGGGNSDVFVAKLNMDLAGNASLIYSTYLGGSGEDRDENVVVDSSGNAYLTGSTSSPNFPTTPGAFQTSYGGGSMDAFVTKLNSAGNGVLYSTYLGGSLDDNGEGIALDSSGKVYIFGDTGSVNFPTTASAFRTVHGGGLHDAFVAKLDLTQTGSAALVYSTYLGGSGDDNGEGIALDSAGNVYVTGDTDSVNFPTTAGALQTSYGGGPHDAFVAKLDLTKTGSASLVYSSYLGGGGNDAGGGLALDAARNVYVTGRTSSANFPTTPGAFQTSYRGGSGLHDAFVTKLNLNAVGSAALVYSTYLGGSGDEKGEAVAVDSAGNAYVVGSTGSGDFPTTQGALQTSYRGGSSDGFVTKLNANGNALLYSTYLGATGDDQVRGVTLDAAGNAYVVGTTSSFDFPISNPFQSSNAAGTDAFAAKLTNLADLTISVAPPSVTVNRGQPATYTVTVTPQGGAFNDPVSLACSNLPARTACSFNPPSVTPGASPAPSTMTISTTAGSSLFGAPRGWQRPLPILLLSIVFVILALVWVNRGTKTPRKVALAYGCLPLVILLAGLTVACGGGGSSAGGGSNNPPPPPPQQGTPPGTYAVTVTGTSGSLQRTTTATLVVQ